MTRTDEIEQLQNVLGKLSRPGSTTEYEQSIEGDTRTARLISFLRIIDETILPRAIFVMRKNCKLLALQVNRRKITKLEIFDQTAEQVNWEGSRNIDFSSMNDQFRVKLDALFLDHIFRDASIYLAVSPIDGEITKILPGISVESLFHDCLNDFNSRSDDSASEIRRSLKRSCEEKGQAWCIHMDSGCSCGGDLYQAEELKRLSQTIASSISDLPNEILQDQCRKFELTLGPEKGRDTRIFVIGCSNELFLWASNVKGMYRPS